jgi:aspartate aminotransferase/aminotransferase
MVGGRVVLIDTYPDFHIDLNRVRDAITPRTKAILFNSPANPTGVVATRDEIRGLAELAREKNVCLVSDEIYRLFCYDEPFVSPATFNEHTLVVDGFSKTYGLTGWRLGFCHGPANLIQQMIKLQQYTFVCAPQPAQWAGAAALDVDMSQHVADYRRKRDMLADGLKNDYELCKPGGAFYAFPRVPWGNCDEFVRKAIENQLLIIPGNIFSKHNTHFRISYAATDRTLERGIEVLKKLAKK